MIFYFFSPTKYNFPLISRTPLTSAGARCVKVWSRADSPLQRSKERPETFRRGISASRAPRNTCCNHRTRLFPAVIGQRVVCQTAASRVLDVKTCLAGSHANTYFFKKKGESFRFLTCLTFLNFNLFFFFVCFSDSVKVNESCSNMRFAR